MTRKSRVDHVSGRSLRVKLEVLRLVQLQVQTETCLKTGDSVRRDTENAELRMEKTQNNTKAESAKKKSDS